MKSLSFNNIKTDSLSELYLSAALVVHFKEKKLKDLLLKNKIAYSDEVIQLFNELQFILPWEKFVDRITKTLEVLSDEEYRSFLRYIIEHSSKELFDISVEYLLQNSKEILTNNSQLDRLLVSLADIKDGMTILDPSVGFGYTLNESLAFNPGKIIGQDINENILLYASVLFIINGACETKLYHENVLINPEYFHEQQIDRVIQVPPFSLTIKENLSNDPYGRFKFGPILKNGGELAFISNAISSLKPGGKAVLLVSPGFLFKNDKTKIARKSFIDFDLVETVISLPAGLVQNTGIRTAILVFNTQKKTHTDQIQFIKVTDGMISHKNHRFKYLKDDAIKMILETYFSKREIDYFSKNVSLSDIKNTSLVVEDYIQDKYIEIDDQLIQIDFDALKKLQTVKLGEIAEVKMGFNSLKSDEHEEGNYKIVRISDLTDDGLNHFDLKQIVSKDDKLDSYLLEAGDILMSARGVLNKICLVEQDETNLIFHSNLFRIRVKPTYLARWLKIYLESSFAQALIQKMSKTTAITLITPKDFKELPVPVVSLEGQQRATEIYESKMSALKEKMAALKMEEIGIKQDFCDSISISEVFTIQKEG